MDVDLAAQRRAQRKLLRLWLNELVLGLLGRLDEVDIALWLFFRGLIRDYLGR
jgi:hypothetical protein